MWLTLCPAAPLLSKLRLGFSQDLTRKLAHLRCQLKMVSDGNQDGGFRNSETFKEPRNESASRKSKFHDEGWERTFDQGATLAGCLRAELHITTRQHHLESWFLRNILTSFQNWICLWQKGIILRDQDLSPRDLVMPARKVEQNTWRTGSSRKGHLIYRRRRCE